MSFRSDADAMRFRHDALARELDELEAKLGDLALVQAARDRLAAELAQVRRDLDRGPTGAPIRLASLRIATPCKQRWDDMTGDGRVRTCASCEKPVFDIAGMTTEEAEAFLTARAGKACVRLYKRADGTIKTADCPPTKARWAAAAMTAGALAASVGGAAMSNPRAEPDYKVTHTLGLEHPDDYVTLGELVIDPKPE